MLLEAGNIISGLIIDGTSSIKGKNEKAFSKCKLDEKTKVYGDRSGQRSQAYLQNEHRKSETTTVGRHQCSTRLSMVGYFGAE